MIVIDRSSRASEWEHKSECEKRLLGSIHF